MSSLAIPAEEGSAGIAGLAKICNHGLLLRNQLLFPTLKKWTRS
ncbi:MAG TPA: hypothetical protein VJN02_03775 [Gammaproteobacteria bacterium]|nr:hypothetical protein [Gammaproteobacteria bacterium]